MMLSPVTGIATSIPEAEFDGDAPEVAADVKWLARGEDLSPVVLARYAPSGKVCHPVNVVCSATLSAQTVPTSFSSAELKTRSSVPHHTAERRATSPRY